MSRWARRRLAWSWSAAAGWRWSPIPNRFTGRGAQWLSVVSVRAALLGRPALVGQVRAGSFPRQFATSPDGRALYVTNFSSGQLETIQVAGLVRAARVR